MPCCSTAQHPVDLPWLFNGKLPDLNLGSAKGASSAPELVEAVRALHVDERVPSVVDGRFKGGYITRHYGQPKQGVHALQLELGQQSYMDDAPPYRWDAQRAAAMQALLAKTIEVVAGWAQARAGKGK